MERLGGWFFRYRTSLPLPLALALLLVPAQRNAAPFLLDAGGAALVAAGELVRLWAVRHIGAISRTRSDRLGPLVATGPFAFVRNPLYLGNLALWVGFALSAHVPWMALVVFAILALEYHAIVRWEERLLEARRGEEFRAYAARVPRWIPGKKRRGRGDRRDRRENSLSATSAGSAVSAIPFSWRETLFSERGTLIAIAVGYVMVWIKLKS